MDTGTIIISAALSLIAIIFSVYTFVYAFYGVRKKNSLQNTNVKPKRNCQKLFRKNSDIGKMIDTIKFWELSNKGVAMTEEDEINEAKSFSQYLYSDTDKIIMGFLEN